MEIKNRDLYLKKLISFRDTDVIKVITGIRRCGKSSLMKLMINYLLSDGVSEEQIISINFESMQYRRMSVDDFYAFVSSRIPKDKKAYLFFDEVQHVPDWQDAVNSFRIDFPCDIYITGSNAYLLSSELATYLSGRYVEIKMLPLSFKEFIEFCGYTLEKNNLGRFYAHDNRSAMYTAEELFRAYLKFGGMPSIAEAGLDWDKSYTLLDGVYSTVVIRDILERERQRGHRQPTDAELLRKIIMFLADNIGSSVSSSSIGNVLGSEGLLENRRTAPAVQTVQAYINALTEAYIFYKANRYDIKGKEYLRTLGKYYVVDIGLRNYLLGLREGDTGHIIENIVYLELLRRGFDTSVGKLDNAEVDFVAADAHTRIYYQVSQTIRAESTMQRELSPLLKIHDNYEKVILTLDDVYADDCGGVKTVNVIDWLLNT